jgi:hypothetical protein
MIDLNVQNEWQHRCNETGLVFPWYTKSFLDELVTWDLADKVVFEYGAGASTLWWHKKCQAVYGAESNKEWFMQVVKATKGGGCITLLENKEDYIKAARQFVRLYDIVVVDGEPIQWRDDCIPYALAYLKPGGKLIIDNWMQDSVGWLPSGETKALLAPYPCDIFKQEGHPDWKTAVFTKI